MTTPKPETKPLLNWWLIPLFVLVPFVIAGLFILYASAQELFRYDEIYFTPEYQEAYGVPYLVSHRLEEVLQQGDNAVYAELTGLRNPPSLAGPDPNIVYAILLSADEQGYLHYMFFNKKTYQRSTYYLTEVNERWVVSPEDAHFLYHSGQWLKAFLPITLVYQLLLFIIFVVIIVYRLTERLRQDIFG